MFMCIELNQRIDSPHMYSQLCYLYTQFSTTRLFVSKITGEGCRVETQTLFIFSPYVLRLIRNMK